MIISDIGNLSGATRKSIKGASYTLKTSGISPISQNKNPEYCLMSVKRKQKQKLLENILVSCTLRGPPSAVDSARVLSTLRMKINFGLVPGLDIINTYCQHTCENCTKKCGHSKSKRNLLIRSQQSVASFI